MLKYIVKRILMLIPVLLGATFIVFTVMDMTPGDPAVSKLGVDATAEQIEELRESMGLNDPFLLRYGRFIWNLVQGDLGTSYKNNLDVMEQIMQRMPYTFLLSFAALLFAIIVGIPAGIISARRQYTVFDNCTMVLTLVGASAPHFWLGLMGVIVFAVKLGWLPAAYSASGSLALGIVLPMKDHEYYPESICAHNSNLPGYELKDFMTVASLIIDFAAETAFICAGPPCEGEYIPYRL